MLSLFFVPLYVKRKHDKVLENFVRGQIYGYIQANPGTHFNYIKRALGLNNGTLAYHLNVLEHDELVNSRNDGLYKRFYPKDSRIPPANGPNGHFTHVQLNSTQDKIITTIKDKPGLTQKELAKLLGKSTQVVNYNVNAMTQLGLVSLKRDGNKTKCYVQGVYKLEEKPKDV